MQRLILPACVCASKVLKPTHFARDVLYTRGVVRLLSVRFRPSWHIYIGEGPCLVPFFIDTHGQPLTRSRLSSFVQSVLQGAGIPGQFSGHSFRIGAATTATQCSIPDHLIKTMGRWSSDAYQLYVRTPADSVLEVSGRLRQ